MRKKEKNTSKKWKMGKTMQYFLDAFVCVCATQRTIRVGMTLTQD